MVLKLGTPKQYKMATGVAVYFDNELKKLKLQTYQSISLAKAREKPPEDVVSSESGLGKKNIFLHLLSMLPERESGPHLSMSKSRATNHLLGLAMSQAA